jgi:hypothetical protein
LLIVTLHFEGFFEVSYLTDRFFGDIMTGHTTKKAARVAELADATDLKSVGPKIHAGSSPATSTIK